MDMASDCLNRQVHKQQKSNVSPTIQGIKEHTRNQRLAGYWHGFSLAWCQRLGVHTLPSHPLPSIQCTFTVTDKWECLHL